MSPSSSIYFSQVLALTLMGGGKREPDWVAAKTAEESDYPKTWGDLKAQWEQHFMSGFARSSHVPVSRVAEGTPVPPGGALLKVSLRMAVMERPSRLWALGSVRRLPADERQGRRARHFERTHNPHG